jgi:hypothetical protein
MPEKGQTSAKNDISSTPAPGAPTRAHQGKAQGLHKRVLSAAHSLSRGVRSSRSVSGSSLTRNKSIPAAARPAISAPARKFQTQPRALLPPPLSHSTDRHAPFAATNPLKRRKSPSELLYNSEHDHDLLFENCGQEEEAFLPTVVVAQPPKPPQRASTAFVSEATEEPKATKHILEELDIEKDLREAGLDGYCAALKASFRKIALRCNNLG